MSLRLLCVTAHPDDECYAFGGALTLAAQRGVETSVLCLTPGQAGSHRGSASSDKELSEIRRAEFAASCKVLGVQNCELLDYPDGYQDGKLEFANISEMGCKLVEHIRRLRPQVIITFGGDGGLNTHADHTVVSLATTAAFHWSGHSKRFPGHGELYQPQRLYYLTTNFFIPERQRPLPSPWTLTLDIRSVFDRKYDAMRAHASQSALMERAIPMFEQHGQEERYTLAAAIVPQPAVQSTDMFEGVAE